MVKRGKLEKVLGDIASLRKGDAAAAESVEKLRGYLKAVSPHVVAAAAEVVGAYMIVELAADLSAAFERFMSAADKGCRAKQAIAEALIGTEDDLSVYRRGVRHVQLEPAYAGQVDVAAGLRAACAVGLVRANDPDALVVLAELLADGEPEARVAGARALGALGSEGAEAVLRLKALLGDTEGLVVEECFGGLLRMSAEAVPFVGRFLASRDRGVVEAAVLALGESRCEGAFEVLKGWWGGEQDRSLRGLGLMAMASLRREEAISFLEQVVMEGSLADARDGVRSLAIYAYEPARRARVLELARQRGLEPVAMGALPGEK